MFSIKCVVKFYGYHPCSFFGGNISLIFDKFPEWLYGQGGANCDNQTKAGRRHGGS